MTRGLKGILWGLVLAIPCWILILTLLTGCTVFTGAHAVDVPEGWSHCIDSRDGEEWYFHSSEVYGKSQTYFTGHESFYYKDSDGIERRQTTKMKTYIKCTPSEAPWLPKTKAQLLGDPCGWPWYATRLDRCKV